MQLQRSITHSPGGTVTRPRSLRSGILGVLLIALILGFLFLQQLGPLLGSSLSAAPSDPGPLAGTLLIHVVRTGPTEANVVGIAITPVDTVEVLVDGLVVATGAPLWNLDYWFFHLPVAAGSTVQTRIGILTSPLVTVPAYVPQAMGLRGFIYAQGTDLMRDGAPIRLFGPDEATAFIYALDAAGLWGGPPTPSSWGENQLFPSGPGAKISSATDLDSHWREFFRYFLHYQQVAGQPGHPRPNLIRIWVAAQNWRAEGTYLAWKQNPTAFWSVFDRMVYWAKQANVYIVPVLGHSESGNPQPVYFDTSSSAYAHQLEVARAIMTRYDNEPQIAMWDVWNEADVNNGPYWNPIGGVNAYRAWASALIADLRPYSTHHLFTMGHGVTSADYFFNNGPGFSIERHFVFNDIPGLDVSHDHTYMTAEDQYMIDWQASWHQALGKPHYTGELGYNAYPGPSPYGYGYWPWFVQQGRAAGFAAISPMVFWNNGKGVYADYPYTGSLPNYGTSVSFDFSVSLNPTSASLLQGQTTTSTATAMLTGGTAQAVNFSASGQPAGATASLNPTTCAPTCTSTLTVTTSPSTPLGTYPITVTASGGGLVRTATFTLTMDAPCPTAPPSYPSNTWDRVWCDSSLTIKLAEVPDEPVEQFDNNWARGPVAGLRADDIGFRSGRTITIPTAGGHHLTPRARPPGPGGGDRAGPGGNGAPERPTPNHVQGRPTTAPKAAGSAESLTVVGLTPGTRYWFALRTADEVPNWSPISNVVDVTLNTPPQAAFSFSPPSPRVGDLVTFDGSTSTDDKGIVQYDWVFGDAQVGVGQVATHAYAAAGSYTARLTVRDTEGATGTTTTVVTVAPANGTVNLPPRAAFTYAPTAPRAGDLVTFDASSSTDDHGIVQYTWAFGDGQTSAGQVVIHAYAAAGTYDVTLTVRDGDGATGFAGTTLTADVAPGPTPRPTVTSVTWYQDRSQLEVIFSKSMNRTSVQGNLAVAPGAIRAFTWETDARLVVDFAGLSYNGPVYVVSLASGSSDIGGLTMDQGFSYGFRPTSTPPTASPAAELPWFLLALSGLTLGIVGL